MPTIAEVPALLRELADRVEAIGLVDHSELSADFSLSVHHIMDRSDLAKVASLMQRPTLDSSVPCVGGYFADGCRGRITAFYEGGILGGERVEVFIDSQAGLDALCSEFAAQEELLMQPNQFRYIARASYTDYEFADLRDAEWKYDQLRAADPSGDFALLQEEIATGREVFFSPTAQANMNAERSS